MEKKGSGRSILLQKCIQSHAHLNPVAITGPLWLLPQVEENAIFYIDDIEQIDENRLLQLQQDLNALTQQGLTILLLYTSKLSINSNFYHDRVNISLKGLSLKGTQKLLRAHNVAGAATVILAKRLCDAFCGLPGHIIDTLDLLIEEDWISLDAQGKYRSQLPTHVLSKSALPTPTFLQQEIEINSNPYHHKPNCSSSALPSTNCLPHPLFYVS